MKINSKRKGSSGERELARKLREYGYDARRSQQYAGINNDADVVGLDGIHIECKRVERLNIDDAMAQSKAETKSTDIPVVMHRKNHSDWKVTMSLDDFMRMYKAWEGSES